MQHLSTDLGLHLIPVSVVHRSKVSPGCDSSVFQWGRAREVSLSGTGEFRVIGRKAYCGCGPLADSTCLTGLLVREKGVRETQESL